MQVIPAGAVTLTDDTGMVIDLPAGGCRRLVALYGAVSELLCAMGSGDRLVGRTDADARLVGLERLAALPSVGTHMRPDPERIVALCPDLVIQILGRQDALEQVNRLRRLGVAVAAFHLTSVNDVLRMVDVLGLIVDAQEQAACLRRSLQQRLDAVAGRVAQCARTMQRPSVVFEVRWPNLLVAGKQSLVDDIISRAGGINVVSGEGRVVRLNEETLLTIDPDVYIYQRGPMNTDPSHPAQRPHFAALRAVVQGRTLEVDEAMFSRPGPRVVEAVELLSHILWP